MDIFADEDEGVVEPVVEAPVEVQRDEQGRFAAKGEEEEVASPAPVEEPVFEHAAVMGERKRRQEAEARADALEAQIQAYQQTQHQPPEAPSIWDDDQGALAHNKDQAVQEAVQQSASQTRLMISEMMVRQAEPEFDAMREEFLTLARATPGLAEETLNAISPWGKAMEVVKNHRTMRDLGATNVAEMEARLREKIMAEINTAPALPTSLADAQSARGGAPNGTAAYSLADILGR